MTRAQLEEIRACVEGEELIGGNYERRGACCFIGKLTQCFTPVAFEDRDFFAAEFILEERYNFSTSRVEDINDEAAPGDSPSPLRAPAVLAYLETLVED